MRERVLKIGIRSYAQAKDRLVAIARGEGMRSVGEPDVWFTSLASLGQLLSESNQDLLRLIARRRPSSLTELAELSGREVSNLSRTLATMESYGMIEFEEGAGRQKAPRLTFDRLEVVVPAFEPGGERNVA